MSDEKSVREQARAMALAVDDKLWTNRLRPPSCGEEVITLLASELEPLFAAKAEAERTMEQRCTAHAAFTAEGDCVFCDKEQADESAKEAWQVADALAAALREVEWGGQTWDSPGDSMLVAACPECDAQQEHLGHEPDCKIRAAIALHSEAKKR